MVGSKLTELDEELNFLTRGELRFGATFLFCPLTGSRQDGIFFILEGLLSHFSISFLGIFCESTSAVKTPDLFPSAPLP
jgi:hypothetical protein